MLKVIETSHAEPIFLSFKEHSLADSHGDRKLAQRCAISGPLQHRLSQTKCPARAAAGFASELNCQNNDRRNSCSVREWDSAFQNRTEGTGVGTFDQRAAVLGCRFFRILTIGCGLVVWDVQRTGTATGHGSRNHKWADGILFHDSFEFCRVHGFNFNQSLG